MSDGVPLPSPRNTPPRDSELPPILPPKPSQPSLPPKPPLDPPGGGECLPLTCHVRFMSLIDTGEEPPPLPQKPANWKSLSVKR